MLTLFPRFSNSSILRCRFSASNLRIKHKKLVEFWWIRQTEISHNDELKMVRLKPRRKFLVVAPDIHVKSYLPRARYLPPPKFCVSIVFNFSWNGCNTQEKWKTKVMQNLGGQIRCIMGDVQEANRPFYRYGGHIELIRLKEYYRIPRGHEHISFVFSSAFRDFFSWRFLRIRL